MKNNFSIGLLVALLCANEGRATLYTETFSPGAAIADGNPVGSTFVGNVGNVPAGQTVGRVSVQLNLTGGYNGDLYAYLVSPNGTIVTLLDRPGVAANGFGAYGSGMNITLQDGASDHGSIQAETSGLALSGTYNAAGSLVSFNGSPADGTWTLFFADMANGGGSSELNSWSLNLTAVPEPINVALGIFGGFVAMIVARRFFTRKACAK